MRRQPRFFAALLPLLLAPPVAAAGDAAYVVCDNGLRCVKAPCPSTTAWDLASGQAIKGVQPDLAQLAEGDRERIRQTDAFYYGRLVVRGRIDATPGGPSLVVTGIERAAEPAEHRNCPAS